MISNLVVVSTPEGKYTFVVHYADQFEKLLNLLKKVVPEN